MKLHLEMELDPFCLIPTRVEKAVALICRMS